CARMGDRPDDREPRHASSRAAAGGIHGACIPGICGALARDSVGAGELRKLIAVSYAASSARVCRGMSVNAEFTRPPRIAVRTLAMKAGSVASLAATLTYSDSLFAIVSVTPRLTSML